MLYSKTFAIKKVSLWAMQYFICTKNWDSGTILEDSGYNERLTTH